MANSDLVPVRTENDRIVVVPVVRLDDSELDTAAGDEKVAFGLPSLSGVLESVKDFAVGMRNALAAVAPEKTKVEFSIGFAMQAGALTAMFVDGKAEGTVKVTMEWDKAGHTDNDTDNDRDKDTDNQDKGQGKD